MIARQSLMILIFVLFSQVTEASETWAGLSLGISDASTSSTRSASVHAVHMNDLRWLNGLSVGGGARLTSVSKNGSLALGENWQTNGLNQQSLNLMGAVTLQFHSKWSLGFNIDLIGLTMGGATELSRTDGTTGTVSSSPRNTNILLGGRNDKGSLNSEFYLSFYPNEKFRLRAGLSHQVVEFTPPAQSTEKLQRFYDLMFLGADFRF